MGQCPVMIPSEPSQEDQQYYDINALAFHATSRNSGVMCNSNGVEREGEAKESYQLHQHQKQQELLLAKLQNGHSFLRPHEPDRPLRCILHPNEVMEMMSFQAEEFRRCLLLVETQQQQQQQQPLPEPPPKLVRDYTNYEINTIWSAASFDSGSSMLAPSEVAMTTVSAATEHMSNLDRYAPTEKNKKKRPKRATNPKVVTAAAGGSGGAAVAKPNRQFSVMENIDEDTPSVASTASATTTSSPSNGGNSSSSSSRCNAASVPTSIIDIDHVRRRYQSQIQSTSRLEQGSRLGLHHQQQQENVINTATMDSISNMSIPDTTTSTTGPPPLAACQLFLGTCLGTVHQQHQQQYEQQQQQQQNHHHQRHHQSPRRRAMDALAAVFLEDCTYILHLKMKAHLIDYYQYHYLPMFPHSPTPPGICSNITPSPSSPLWKKQQHKRHSSKPNSTPTRNGEKPTSPVRSTSSSMSSSGGIDFFVGPTVFPIRFFLNESIFMDLALTGSLGLVDRRTSRRHSNSGDGISGSVGSGGGNVGGVGVVGGIMGSQDSAFNAIELPHRKSPDHYIVLLHRRSGIPLAVCALKAATFGPPIVRIYATKQRIHGQRCVASTQQLGLNWSDDSTYPLYSWAELVATPHTSTTTAAAAAAVVVDEGMQSYRYDVYMAAEADGRFEPEPSYCAAPAEPGLSCSAMTTMHVVGRTESEESYSGCAIFSLDTKKKWNWQHHASSSSHHHNNHHHHYDEPNSSRDLDDNDNDDDNNNNDNHDDDDEPFFRLSIARGIDPALMICLAAIIDEIMEKSMRTHCEAHTRVALRRARRSD